VERRWLDSIISGADACLDIFGDSGSVSLITEVFVMVMALAGRASLVGEDESPARSDRPVATGLPISGSLDVLTLLVGVDVFGAEGRFVFMAAMAILGGGRRSGLQGR
jgi:hypothetical protein